MTARREAAAERTPSRCPSMADGLGCGAVKPVTVTKGGRLCSRERRQADVMLAVPLGLMRRIEIGLELMPVIEGRDAAIVASGC